jgi:hypothetical protein
MLNAERTAQNAMMKAVQRQKTTIHTSFKQFISGGALLSCALCNLRVTIPLKPLKNESTYYRRRRAGG